LWLFFWNAPSAFSNQTPTLADSVPFGCSIQKEAYLLNPLFVLIDTLVMLFREQLLFFQTLIPMTAVISFQRGMSEIVQGIPPIFALIWIKILLQIFLSDFADRMVSILTNWVLICSSQIAAHLTSL
jgi:hypothetical protein